MKRTFFSGIFILAILNSYAQSIVTSNKLWDNIIYYYNYTIGTEHIKFTDDTIINSMIYKKVERSLDANQMNWSGYGFIREDANKQVFYKLYPSDTERLFYKLNVQVNDTILVYGIFTLWDHSLVIEPINYLVHDFDSIIIGQTYHKRINLSDPQYSFAILERWVDSVGAMGGMLHNNNATTGRDGYALLCFFENEVLEYHDSTYTTCYVNTAINDKMIVPNAVTIEPNPIVDISTLTVIDNISDVNSLSIHLFNLVGKEIFYRKGENNTQIRKMDFPPGIYFYYITYDTDRKMTGKIIVN